jgi:LysM repeat protein
MKIRHFPYFLIGFYFNFISTFSFARISATEYIDTYKYEAINEMLEFGIPASITIAQGILESDCGNSPLAINAFNHFGIKCHVGWTGPTYIQDDDKKNECFRVYNDPRESYRDHSLFLKERTRYADLFKLEITDYKAWAKGLKQAGYATNPVYAEKLIKIIEENQLFKYDQIKNIKAIKHLREKEKFHEILTEEEIEMLKEVLVNKHEVKINNKTKCTIAQKGDTYFHIAKEFDLDVRLLHRYNDLPKTDLLSTGQYIYLKPKRSNADTDFHTVKSGENMHAISQLYGIKLKKLYRKNNMDLGTEAAVGEILSLRKRLRE